VFLISEDLNRRFTFLQSPRTERVVGAFNLRVKSPFTEVWSIQTRLDRHEQVQRLLLWIVGIIGGTLLAGCTSGFVILLRELIARGG